MFPRKDRNRVRGLGRPRTGVAMVRKSLLGTVDKHLAPAGPATRRDSSRAAISRNHAADGFTASAVNRVSSDSPISYSLGALLCGITGSAATIQLSGLWPCRILARWVGRTAGLGNRPCWRAITSLSMARVSRVWTGSMVEVSFAPHRFRAMELITIFTRTGLDARFLLTKPFSKYFPGGPDFCIFLSHAINHLQIPMTELPVSPATVVVRRSTGSLLRRRAIPPGQAAFFYVYAKTGFFRQSPQWREIFRSLHRYRVKPSSRIDALQFGIDALSTIIREESRSELLSTLDALFQEHQPVTPTEQGLVSLLWPFPLAPPPAPQGGRAALGGRYPRRARALRLRSGPVWRRLCRHASVLPLGTEPHFDPPHHSSVPRGAPPPSRRAHGIPRARSGSGPSPATRCNANHFTRNWVRSAKSVRSRSSHAGAGHPPAANWVRSSRFRRQPANSDQKFSLSTC